MVGIREELDLVLTNGDGLLTKKKIREKKRF